MKELSYSKNTFYLLCAGILAQIFGAMQRIILTRYLKEEGMAIYHSAICVYSVFLTLSCGGIPIALTHFVSKERAGGIKNNIFYAICFCLKSICILAAALSILMFLTRGFFSTAMREPRAKYAIAALAPSVFVTALGAVAKACFEGYANMRPCAISQAAEAFIKLILSYVLTSFFCIFSMQYAAFGGALAITLGETAATFILFAFLSPILKKIDVYSCKCNKETRSLILSYALPVTLYAIILSSFDLLENAVIRSSLLAVKFSANAAEQLFLRYSPYTSAFDTLRKTGRLTSRGASWLYGAFFGYALTIIRFPSGLLRTFAVPFFPIAAKCFAEKNKPALCLALSKIIKIMLSVSVYLCLITVIFSGQITSLIFSSDAYSDMLRMASPILVLYPLCGILSTVEYASGRTFIPFLFNFISFMISIPLCASLIRIPTLNIAGVAVASVVAALSELILHIFYLSRYLKIS